MGNIQELTAAIEAGKTSIDWALAKVMKGSKLRDSKHFAADGDPVMTAHMDRLFDFLMELRAKYRPGVTFDPAAKPAEKPTKGIGITASRKRVNNFKPLLPYIEMAKSGSSKCKPASDIALLPRPARCRAYFF